MINIETWFPTFIGQEVLKDNEKIAKKIVPICKEIQSKIKNKENNWVSKLYQTCHTYNIFNVYKKYDFQEFHCHPNRQLSVIYVLKSTKENPKIIFERNEGLYTEEFDVDTKALSTKVRYSSIQGNLLIFRSSLHHCVEMKQDNSERISLAYNFNLKKP